MPTFETYLPREIMRQDANSEAICFNFRDTSMKISVISPSRSHLDEVGRMLEASGHPRRYSKAAKAGCAKSPSASSPT